MKLFAKAAAHSFTGSIGASLERKEADQNRFVVRFSRFIQVEANNLANDVVPNNIGLIGKQPQCAAFSPLRRFNSRIIFYFFKCFSLPRFIGLGGSRNHEKQCCDNQSHNIYTYFKFGHSRFSLISHFGCWVEQK